MTETTKVTADQDYVTDVRKRALEDFFFFARAICGFDRLTDRFHKAMCDHIQNQGFIRRLWLLPRDHYKSTILSTAYPLWRLVRDREERILIAADTATNAEKKLAKIKSLILESPQIRAFFPEIIPPNVNKTTWSDSAITIPRKGAHAEPSISTVGAGGAVIGQHFTHIILDDLVAKEAAESSSVMASIIGWVDNVESLLVEPYSNTIDVVGTRWTHNDIYEHIDNNWPAGNTEDVPNFYYRFQLGFWDGLDYNDSVLFPELYDGVKNAKNFAVRNAQQNPYLWSCNYLNDPQVPEAEFDLEDLRFFAFDHDRENVLFETISGRAPRVVSIAHLALYLTCDPAYSKKAGASHAAICVSGVFPTGEIFLLEAYKGRWGGQGLIRELIRMAIKYRAYLRAIGIEATGTQQAFVDDFRKEARKRQLFCPVDYLQPGAVKGKEARIRFHLQRYIGDRRLYILPEFRDLQREFRHFPLSTERDLLDALAYAADVYWSRNVDWVGEKDQEAKWKSKEEGKNKRTGY